MFEILRKDFCIPIKDSNGKVCFTMKYKQASIEECIQYLYDIQKEGSSPVEHIAKFIIDSSDKDEDIVLAVITGGGIDKFIDIIYKTRFRGFFSSGKACKEKSPKTMPYEAMITFLSKELSIDPNTLVKNYTPEQLNFYSNGIKYNLNEQTKEGQKRNKIEQGLKNNRLSKEELERIKKRRNNINK